MAVRISYESIGGQNMLKNDAPQRQIRRKLMKTVITIGRQFGSGGKSIGQKLAEHYGIGFYDKELIARVAKDSGFCEEIIEQHDERPTNSFLYNLVMDTYSFGYNTSSFVGMPISQKVFLAQFDTIKEIAKEGPAVFIGRCADNALADFQNVLNIFIHADKEFRISRIMSEEQYGKPADRQKAQDLMQKMDKQRQSYYNYYSAEKWGVAKTYDLCINSARLGIDGTADLLIRIIDTIENAGNKR